MSRKRLALTLILATLLLGTAVRAEKVQRIIKTTYVGPSQAIISCRNGHMPVAREAKEVSGSLIVSCAEQK